MTTPEATRLLEQLRRQRQFRSMLLMTVPALGMGALVAAVGYRWAQEAWWVGIPAFLLSWAIGGWIVKPYRVNTQQITSDLNASFPPLEESTHLLLKPVSDLTLLERMQTERVIRALPTVDLRKAAVIPYAKQTGLFCVLLVAALVIVVWPASTPKDPLFAPQSVVPLPLRKASLPAKPRITRLSVSLTPPPYTGKSARNQATADISVESGGRVKWQIETDIPAQEVTLVGNNREVQGLKRQGEAWTGEKVVSENGFYQIKVNNELSDYYRLEVIPDSPPVVVVTQPEPYLQIPFGKPTQVSVNVQLKDDYGLTESFMVATVAKGTGEAVKFREEKMGLGASFTPFQQEARLSKALQLAKLDMAPGDELYFYIQASDNHAQSTRSDMYIISLQDTAVVTLADAMTMGINPVPEYFRSQRQIIIDTEKLLKEQAKLKPDVFKQRSNGIGIDQKVLRLRYGKFLGEEFEDMIGEIAGQEKLVEEGHFDGDGHNHSQNLHGLEAFVHAHDDSEETTFLEPAIKTKLKACLAEMWEAELRLRTYRPKEALPYEYKALKLLKEVQQSSRAYVAKTGFQPPPLKPQEKRLTGELDKITRPTYRQEVEQENKFPAIRQALIVLEKVKANKKLTSTERNQLQKAGSELSGEAIRQPGRYLSALRGLRQLIEETQAGREEVCTDCLRRVEQAFWSVLPPAKNAPEQAVRSASKLGELYRKRL